MQEAVADTDYCILVTEPTPFGLANLREAVETCRRMRVPCGVVINRDREAVCEEMDEYLRDPRASRC
jgi:MinD superfamily P-loop ATPase